MTKKVNNTKEETKKSSPFKRAILNLPFHDFETNPKFTGLYNETVRLGNEPAAGAKDMRFDANVMTDVESGEQYFITDSYSIKKAIEQAKKDGIIDPVFEIDFLGKTEIKGKPFNQFNIGVCSLEDYNEFTQK